MHSLMVFFRGRLVNLPPLHGIVKGELVKNVEILPKTYKYAYLYIEIKRLVILFSHLFKYVLLISK